VIILELSWHLGNDLELHILWLSLLAGIALFNFFPSETDQLLSTVVDFITSNSINLLQIILNIEIYILIYAARKESEKSSFVFLEKTRSEIDLSQRRLFKLGHLPIRKYTKLPLFQIERVFCAF
jgi:hypothetical protein